jgi:hypothetical protein
MVVAMAWVASAHHLPIRDPDGGVVATYIRLPLIVLAAWLVDVFARAFLLSRRDLRGVPRKAVEVTKERWHRRQVVFALSGLVSWYVMYAAFRNLKSYVPFVNRHLYDADLARLDKIAFLGNDPADTLHAIFGTTWAAEFFSVVYVAWIVLIPMTLAISLMWTRASHAGAWFVTAIGVDWVLGVAVYYLVPTLGPIYSAPQHFTDLPPTFVGTLQTDMWQARLDVLHNPWDTVAVQTIAAFASLHVGMMVTICLMAHLLRMPTALKVAGWIFLALTVIATIYLGWHFVTDAVGGAALGTAGVWIAALGTGNHLHGWPRLRSAHVEASSAREMRSA